MVNMIWCEHYFRLALNGCYQTNVVKHMKRTFKFRYVICLKSFNNKHSLYKCYVECMNFYFAEVSLFNWDGFVCYSCIQYKLNGEILYIKKKNIFLRKPSFASSIFLVLIFILSPFWKGKSWNVNFNRIEVHMTETMHFVKYWSITW